MKLLTVTLAACLLALAIAQSANIQPTAEYLPPVAENSAPLAEYIPPEGAETRLAADGYRYKTVRRLKFRRLRREAPSVEYLPPVLAPPSAAPLSAEYLPPVGAETRLADDGYRYKTVRRLRFRARHRRDVSELNAAPSVEYLPPVAAESASEQNAVVANDGYRYKTVRRLKFRRHRRQAETVQEVAAVQDVAAVAESSDVPSAEYLPPPINDVAEEPAMKSAELAQDGYRYKTVRRLRYRHRQ